MAKFAVVPEAYHRALYNFFIGCLWIKFTPLFPAVHKCVATLINSASPESQEKLVKQHMIILKGATWLAQLCPKLEKKLLCQKLLDSMDQILSLDRDGHLVKAYQRDAKLDEDSLDINDFLF